MADLLDRAKIEALVRSALGGATGGAGGERPLDSGGALVLTPDRGANRAASHDPAAMRALLDATPARIGVGRVGIRYRTNTLLRFRADHAAAKDAVLSEVDPQLIERLGFVALTTRAESKSHFLQRPDAGRVLSDPSRAELVKRIAKGAQVMLVYGDGLSAAAINHSMPPFHDALMKALAARGLRTTTPCFVRYSRVKVMDEICRLVEAEACVFVCGERPGLGFADSLSAYYIYRPPSGTPTDADREVISNINSRGLAPVAAATAVAEACARVLAARKSGVVI